MDIERIKLDGQIEALSRAISSKQLALKDVWDASLLRRHHAKIRRMVKKVGTVTASQFRTGAEAAAYRAACTHILAELDRTEKGGK